ncbi:uncharacterized protein VP01_1822g8 [Puccinia sorghi]|uniref:Uncharacterized protein n=1 Tax=Puccinia sorghi TaxID=27349 RepID=A0A0L6VE38_9BASI|nr:uncharacterized protein VP01_1822g8 [Puccinia sorghi]
MKIFAQQASFQQKPTTHPHSEATTHPTIHLNHIFRPDTLISRSLVLKVPRQLWPAYSPFSLYLLFATSRSIFDLHISQWNYSIISLTLLDVRLLKTFEVEKAQEYNNILYSVFESLKLHDNLEVARMIWNTPWRYFAQEKTSLDSLKKDLNLNDKDHSDKIHTLIRCAHFVRFPGCDDSNLTDKQILAKLNGTATLVGNPKHHDPEIKWSTEIVQQGFHAPYQRHDLIVAPTLKTLAEYAEQWDCSKHKAPYTSIIGPTMTGKTRLLMELAKYVPVVYVCLRPSMSTGQPPRSGLASEFLPNSAWILFKAGRICRLERSINCMGRLQLSNGQYS